VPEIREVAQERELAETSDVAQFSEVAELSEVDEVGEAAEVGEKPTVGRADRWVPPPKQSLPSVELSNRWLVSAAMAAVVGSAVFLALEPNGALGLVGELAGSLRDLGGVARDLLDRLVIGSRAASL
jgi:hypothetical protein